LYFLQQYNSLLLRIVTTADILNKYEKGYRYYYR